MLVTATSFGLAVDGVNLEDGESLFRGVLYSESYWVSGMSFFGYIGIQRNIVLVKDGTEISTGWYRVLRE